MKVEYDQKDQCCLLQVLTTMDVVWISFALSLSQDGATGFYWLPPATVMCVIPVKEVYQTSSRSFTGAHPDIMETTNR